MSVLCLYAAVLSARPGRGIAREALAAIERDGYSIVAGAMPGVPEPTAVALRAYDRVVRRLAAATDAIVPFRFGTIVSPSDLDAAIAPIEDALREALALVRGREQMTLRLFGDGDVARPRARATKGALYLASRAASADAADAIARLRRALGRLVRAEVVERHDGPLRVSLYHLVDRGRAADYRARVDRASRAIAPLRAHVTGPWAPYAFGGDAWR
jgi:hypothetical protein